jgi:hypothetical protein
MTQSGHTTRGDIQEIGRGQSMEVLTNLLKSLAINSKGIAIFFSGSEILTQGFTLAWKALYCWSHVPTSFTLVVLEMVSLFAKAGLDLNLSTYASCVAGMTDALHHTHYFSV